MVSNRAILNRFCSIVNASTVGRKCAAGLNDETISFFVGGLVDEDEEIDDDDDDDGDEDDEVVDDEQLDVYGIGSR